MLIIELQMDVSRLERARLPVSLLLLYDKISYSHLASVAPYLEDEIKQIPSTSSLCKKANEHISQNVKLFLLEQK